MTTTYIDPLDFLINIMYNRTFGMKRILSTELQNKEKYEKYYKKGFRYIRRYREENYKNILRNPTVGCYVEIFYTPQQGTVLINSVKGRKLINKFCYY